MFGVPTSTPLVRQLGYLGRYPVYTVSDFRRYLNHMKFSILNLLLVLTAAAAMLGLYRSRQALLETAQRYEFLVSELNAKHAELESQNRALRQELGCLTMIDPKKIHAVKLRTNAPGTWSYRVHLPEGANYYVACKINSLSLKQNLPAMTSRSPLGSFEFLGRNSEGTSVPAGEFVVTLKVFEDDDGEWKFRLNVRTSGDAGNGNTATRRINDLVGKWPNVDSFNGLATGGISNQRVFHEDAGPCVLLDLRALSDKVTSSADSDQGAMLWVGILK